MQIIFGLFYTLLFLCYILAAFFVVFHLLRYSLNKQHGFIGAVVFIFVTVILLFTNALLFFSLPLSQLLPSNTLLL